MSITFQGYENQIIVHISEIENGWQHGLIADKEQTHFSDVFLLNNSHQLVEKHFTAVRPLEYQV